MAGNPNTSNQLWVLAIVHNYEMNQSNNLIRIPESPTERAIRGAIKRFKLSKQNVAIMEQQFQQRFKTDSDTGVFLLRDTLGV